MPNIPFAAARQSLRNKFGKVFEEKASDAYVEKFFLESQQETAVIREAGAGPVKESIILEFDGQQADEVKREAGLESATMDSRIKEAMTTIPDLNEQAKTALRQHLKNSKIKSYKEKSMMKVQSINAFIEKKIGDSFIHKPTSSSNKPFVSDYCWLNHSMKTHTDPETIAEAIQDDKVTAVDIPRRLVGEINKTVPGLFASQYVQKFSKSGKGISVAIIDSEVFFDHPALKGRVIKAENYTSEPWGNPDFHGTAIAGIIGSTGNTTNGIINKSFTGIAPGVTMHNYKVLAKFGINADDFGGSKAIEKAVEDGMHIANCSWGVAKISNTVSREAKACNTAWDLGLVIVKSAGNNGPGISSLTTPAEADGVIVVGASGRDFKKVENYSSRGPLPAQFNGHRPHLIAPGGTDSDNILSCRIEGDFGPVGRGSSYAAPHVSGLLALILEENPDLSNDELKDFAIRLCTAFQNTNPDIQGNGIISLRSLVK